MSSIKSFLNKSLGMWESHRIYMYPKPGKIEYSVTYFEWTEKDGIYAVDWNNPKLNSTGRMSLRLKTDFYLERSRGYFTDDVTTSTIKSGNNEVLHTETVYNNTLFDERIEFLGPDNRFRRTIAYKLDLEGNKTSEVTLAGTYMEKRLCIEKSVEDSLEVYDSIISKEGYIL